MGRVCCSILERLAPHTEEPTMREDIAHVAFDMHKIPSPRRGCGRERDDDLPVGHHPRTDNVTVGSRARSFWAISALIAATASARSREAGEAPGSL